MIGLHFSFNNFKHYLKLDMVWKIVEYQIAIYMSSESDYQ